jgi:two-component system, NtrC family, response regulator AtoC
MSARLLLVDDDRSLCEWVAEALLRRDFSTEWRTDPARALELLGAEDFDVVATDLHMQSMSGLDVCARIVQSRPDIPVVVITAFGSLETAVAAIRAGAYDFITKPFDIDVLQIALSRAVQHRALRGEVKRLREAVAQADRFQAVLGESPAMRQLSDLLRRVAASDATVLVTGESGSGKEVAARAIHQESRRRSGPFVALSCAAVPEALLESELFGHKKGAFTDAREARAGLLHQAEGGTLLLDEIGDMPISLQPKLLRALEQRTARPVGGETEMPFDARIIAATNRDLEEAVEEKRFREDLFYRLNVIQVQVPPLRARGNDVLLLAQRFLEGFAAHAKKAVRGISAPAAEKLLAYSWPGNVRELRNCMERAVALTRFEELLVEDLPDKLRAYRPSHVVVAAEDPTELAPLEEVERRYIQRVLESVQGNRTLAAKILGVDRTTLYRKLGKRSAPEEAT